jgi:hypothetical protein
VNSGPISDDVPAELAASPRPSPVFDSTNWRRWPGAMVVFLGAIGCLFTAVFHWPERPIVVVEPSRSRAPTPALGADEV